ncbi:hypothetical protein HBI78_013670 [Parastagonospora nodorum]|nr:hypothetical protein HBI78_013670 [Parastagonospora nodorum]
MTSTHCPLRELGARHGLLNLSVHDLVEEFARHNCSSLYYSDSNSDTATRKTRIKAREREAELDSLLDSDDYRLDSSLDIDSEDNSEDEEERLKALLNAKYNKGQSLCESRDGNRTLHSRRLTGAYILYFKELLSDNGRIFASVIGMTRTRAIVLSAIIGYVYFKN